MLDFTTVDAFTRTPFGGNPAAIVVTREPVDAGLMQRIALEMNLSETAFLVPEADGFRLRWFTPVCEVDLCGHATLAASHALWEGGWLAPDQPARYHTRSGLLTATREPDGWIALDFPSEPPAAVPPPVDLAQALRNCPIAWVGQNRFDLFVELEHAADLRRLDPDQTRLAAYPVRGVIVTSRGDGDGFDLLSRFFAPRVGVPEDPVCGSAHCALAPYWADRLGKPELLAYQASARGGTLRLQLRGNRVRLIGQAVTTVRGQILT